MKIAIGTKYVIRGQKKSRKLIKIAVKVKNYYSRVE